MLEDLRRHFEATERDRAERIREIEAGSAARNVAQPNYRGPSPPNRGYSATHPFEAGRHRQPWIQRPMGASPETLALADARLEDSTNSLRERQTTPGSIPAVEIILTAARKILWSSDPHVAS